MADTINVDILSYTRLPVMVPVILQNHPVYDYSITEEELLQIIQLPNYVVYLAGTTNIIHGSNIEHYFPHGGGGGGTSDYPALSNKPKINSVTLVGDLSASQLSLVQQPATGEVGQVLAVKTVRGSKPDTLEFVDPQAGVKGDPGKSAYEVAVDAGYIGTEEEWLASLKGETGTNGKSAYEVAVEEGYVGTKEEWLLSLRGEQGVEGKSAYQVACEQGYVGTIDEWLASLKGNDGKSAYEIAVSKGYTGTEEEWLLTLKGEKGKSAYEVAVDEGYIGTEEQWLASLKGETGTSVTSATVDDSGDLIITMSTGTEITAGHVKGADGTSINIKATLDSTEDLPDVAEKGDAYLINGYMWIYTGETKPGMIKGFANVGKIQGPQGVGISNVTLTNNKLYVTLTNGVVIEAGTIITVKGDDGVGIKSASVDSDNKLSFTRTDDSVIEAGTITTLKGDTGVGISNVTVDEENVLKITLDNEEVITAGTITTLKGDDGKSAYDVACETGYIGTKEEWIASLKGAKGDDGKSAYQVACDKGYVGTEEQWLATLKGEKGDQGISVVNATVNNLGNLIITLSEGEPIDAGHVKGADGTSITIKDTLESTEDLPDVAEKGDAYLIDGDLWVYTGTESRAVTVKGFSNVGKIQGPKGDTGVGIKTITVDDENVLKITLDNNQVITAGTITTLKGDDGISISDVAVDSENVLKVTLSDERIITAGTITTLKGDTGTGIYNVTVGTDNKLTVSLDDGTDIDAGTITTLKGDDGVGIKSVSVDADNKLQVTLTNDEIVDAGTITTLKGDDGKSAYEIACDKGYVGTEEQWLATLKGKSAYQVAVDNGFQGTEEEWLESLKADVDDLTGFDIALTGYTIAEEISPISADEDNVSTAFGKIEFGKEHKITQLKSADYETLKDTIDEGSLFVITDDFDESPYYGDLTGTDIALTDYEIAETISPISKVEDNVSTALGKIEFGKEHKITQLKSADYETLKDTIDEGSLFVITDDYSETTVNPGDGTIIPGADGKSAYEIAVVHGFRGTEAQWLESLKGTPGTNGTNGTDGEDGISITDATIDNSGDLIITLSEGSPINAGHVVGSQGIQGIQGIQGETGLGIKAAFIRNTDDYLVFTMDDNSEVEVGVIPTLSPYDIATEENPDLTKEEWLESLKGTNGVSITDVTLNSDNTLTVTLSSGDPIKTSAITTVKGDQGIQGVSIVDLVDNNDGTFKAKLSNDTFTSNITMPVDKITPEETLYINRFADNTEMSAVATDVFITLPVEPETAYTFDASEYSWVGVQTAEGMVGHTAEDKVINFVTGAGETSVVAQFYPGRVPFDIEEVDYSSIKFYKTEGDSFTDVILHKQDKLFAGKGITISDNVIKSSLVIDTELNTSSNNPIANSAVATALNTISGRVKTLEDIETAETTKTETVETTFILEGLQLENGATYVGGSTTRITSDFIPITTGDRITFTCDGDDWNVSGCYYDSDKKYVSSWSNKNWAELNTFEMEMDGYIRAAFRQGGYSGTVFTEESASLIHIERTYDIDNSNITVDTELSTTSNHPIANKTVATAINSIWTTLNGFLSPEKFAIPCGSGFTNFTSSSLYWKTPDNVVHITAAITVTSTCELEAVVFTMPVGYRPSATVVLPCTISYESNYVPTAGGINVNTDGTCKYYGISLPSNRHIIVNAIYCVPSTSTQSDEEDDGIAVMSEDNIAVVSDDSVVESSPSPSTDDSVDEPVE